MAKLLHIFYHKEGTFSLLCQQVQEYPVKANIWNGYSYIRWRMERLMNLG